MIGPNIQNNNLVNNEKISLLKPNILNKSKCDFYIKNLLKRLNN
jgi:hypothetical protein